MSDLNEFADVLCKKFVSFFGVLFRESPQENHRTTIMICHYSTLLDLIITVPVFTIPNGGNYSEFFGDPIKK